MRIVTALTVPLIALALAGCIGDPQAASLEELQAPATRGTMTAEEQERVEEGRDGAAYYAERVVTITGDLTLDALPVELSTFAGGITLGPAPAGTWDAEVRLRGEGPTAEDARRALEAIDFSWSHEDEDGHVLRIKVEQGPDVAPSGPAGPLPVPVPIQIGGLGAVRKSGVIQVRLSEGVVLPAAALATASGAIAYEGLAAGELAVATASGDVSVDAPRVARANLASSSGSITLAGNVAHVAASSSGGRVSLDVVPFASGGISATSAGGDVSVTVPETARHGYAVEATAASGKATIGLRDGEDRRSEDGKRASFVTDGFPGREVQTRIEASSASGDVAVN